MKHLAASLGDLFADSSKKSEVGLMAGMVAYIIGSINLTVIVAFMLVAVEFLATRLSYYKNGKKFDKQALKDELVELCTVVIFWFSAVLMQLALFESGPKIGITIDFPIISVLATFWIIGNEFHMIGNRLSESGYRLPGWWTALSKKIKNFKPKI